MNIYDYGNWYKVRCTRASTYTYHDMYLNKYNSKINTLNDIKLLLPSDWTALRINQFINGENMGSMSNRHKHPNKNFKNNEIELAIWIDRKDSP